MEMSLKGAFGMEGKTVLITGGGSGLGFAMAQCFVAAGARAVIVGRREDVLKEACAKLGERAQYRTFDVTEFDHLPDFVAQIEHEIAPVDVLINNAGRHCKKPVSDVTLDDMRAVFDVHILASHAFSKAVLPGMIERHDGSILFISSMSAYLGMTQVAAYSAAKTAVLGMTRSYAGEVSQYGVRVNAIAPGFIDTPMFRKATDADPARQKKILGHTPMERYGEPLDVGWAAVYLASPAAKFVTGVCLPVDGGCCIGF